MSTGRMTWKRAAWLVLGAVLTLLTGDPYQFPEPEDDWPDAYRHRPGSGDES